MKWLKRLAWSATEDVVDAPPLPDALISALDSRRYDAVKPAIRDWCAGQPEGAALEALIAAARSRGWGAPAELEILEILFEYFGGDLQRAFQLVRDRSVGEHFHPDLYVLGLVALFTNNQYEDAHAFLSLGRRRESALADFADYWMMKALVCWTANDMADLRGTVDRMCALSPDDTTTLENACAMYLELGAMTEFWAARERLMHGRHRVGYAFSLNTLALGDYEEGFAQMEARYEMADAARLINGSLFALPRWRGQDLTGKTLLITAEQGLGDTIQMARYFPLVSALPAAKVIVETQSEALSLLQFNFPEFDFVVREHGVRPSPDFDVWEGSMSLPHIFHTTADSVPARSGYLNVPPESIEYWHRRVVELAPRRRMRIGLAWSGNPIHRADRRRSISYACITDFIRGIDADVFALQTSVPPNRPSNLIDLSEEMITLADTAALIAEMDLIISVDTSVVHLAGAIGKKTWLLLPYRYEWRWGLEGEENHWYDSVRVLRQRTHGDWDTILHEVLLERLPRYRLLQGIS